MYGAHAVDEGTAGPTRVRARPPADVDARPAYRPRASTGGRGRRSRSAAGAPPVRRVGAFIAAEHPGAYDPTPHTGSAPPHAHAWDAGGDRAATAAGAGERTGERPGGPGASAAPRTAEATVRLRRCVTTPGSPLGAAMGQLADAADALAAVAVADEHVDVAGDALVALHHLRSRLDATLLGLLASFDRREGWAPDGAANACMWLRAHPHRRRPHRRAGARRPPAARPAPPGRPPGRR